MSSILEELITGLNIIATIKSGQTLTRRSDKLTVIEHNHIEGVRRWWLEENCHTTKKLIKEYVMRSVEYAMLLMESKYIHLTNDSDALYVQKYAERINSLTSLRKALIRSKEGIHQTSNTYNSDVTLQEEYKTVINTIEYHVGEINYKLEGLIKK